MARLRGALAAAVTPLRDGGAALDEDAFGPYADFLVAGGLDGILALGTTGEGILLAPAERRRVVELYVEAAAGRLQVAAHCGAQTTRDTVELAEHAATVGVDAVAVIGPPYFQLDERALLEHFAAAAAACAPLPFYVYEFERASGYAVPLPVLFKLRERASNLAGLKVSDAPFERFKPYLIEGLDVFVGPEVLIADGIGAGAVGAVSALGSAFPEQVAAAVREPLQAASVALGELRAAIERAPRHAALKAVLGLKGVPVREDVRRPLRAAARERAQGARGLARIVVAGAGAIGASIAYHLALAGADDVVLAEAGEIAGGATGKAMGGVRQQFTTEAEVRLAQASVRALPRARRAALRAGRLPLPRDDRAGLATNSRSGGPCRSRWACRSSAWTRPPWRVFARTTSSTPSSAARTASPIRWASRGSSCGGRRGLGWTCASGRMRSTSMPTCS